MLSYVTIHGMASRQLLHKTLAQLRRWDTSDLQAPDDALHTLLEERTREAAAPLPVKPGRTMVAERRQGTVTLRLEYVGPHLAKGDVWAKYVHSGAHSSGESAVVLAGTRHPTLRVARKCAQTASCEVVPAPEGQMRAKSGVIGPQCVVKRGKRT